MYQTRSQWKWTLPLLELIYTYFIEQLCASLYPSPASQRKTIEDIEHIHRLPKWTRWHKVTFVLLHCKPWEMAVENSEKWFGTLGGEGRHSGRTSSILHPTNCWPSNESSMGRVIPPRIEQESSDSIRQPKSTGMREQLGSGSPELQKALSFPAGPESPLFCQEKWRQVGRTDRRHLVTDSSQV